MWRVGFNKKIDILVCYINCKDNKGTKNDTTTKKQKEERDLWGSIGQPNLHLSQQEINRLTSVAGKLRRKPIVQKYKQPPEKLKTETTQG